MRLLITFETTYEVLMFEKYGVKHELKGRISPVPRKYSANCGLCWLGPVESRKEAEVIISRYELSYDKIYEIE